MRLSVQISDFGFTKLILLLGVLVALILAGCDTAKDRSEDIALIYGVLDKRKQAVTEKDIQLYQSLFLVDYDELGLTRKDIVEEMKQLFSTNEQLSLTFPRTRPNIKMNSARVIHTVIYEFPDKPKLSFRETLLLRRVGGTWYISGGMQPGMLR